MSAWQLLLAALALAFPLLAGAQGNQQASPADPSVRVSPLKYESAFSDYRPFAEEKVAPWRGSNDAVKGGGAREGHAAEPPAQPKPAAKPPAKTEHGGHR